MTPDTVLAVADTIKTASNSPSPIVFVSIILCVVGLTNCVVALVISGR